MEDDSSSNYPHTTADARWMYRYLAALVQITVGSKRLLLPLDGQAARAAFSSALLITGIQSLALPPFAALFGIFLVIYALVSRA